MVTDSPGDVEGVQGPEVVSQRGVLRRDPQLSSVVVDVCQQGVHVGKLHRGIEELLVAPLRAGWERGPVPLPVKPHGVHTVMANER